MRKTSGVVTGRITVNGYPINESTYRRTIGYCEQLDLHSPFTTVKVWALVFPRDQLDVRSRTHMLFALWIGVRHRRLSTSAVASVWTGTSQRSSAQLSSRWVSAILA